VFRYVRPESTSGVTTAAPGPRPNLWATWTVVFLLAPGIFADLAEEVNPPALWPARGSRRRVSGDSRPIATPVAGPVRQEVGAGCRAANERFINFEEGGISELRTAGAVGSGVAYLFGTPGAVVALCIIVLTEVATRSLSSRGAKIAAAAAQVDDLLARARIEVGRTRTRLDDRIDAMETLDWGEWMRVARAIERVRVPVIARENIIYRDLLLAFARGGGYSITGSQWNVDNLAIFGDAPWYHTSDWGSPGWTNGQDIAEELNALAEGDPSTRKTVRINP
jgi:hypothetical protein